MSQPDSAYTTHRAFELSGQVLSCSRNNFTLKDSSGTLSIQADSELLKAVVPGNFIRTRGELCISSHGINDKRAHSIVVTGFAPVPELQDVTAGQIGSGAFVHQRVRVTGVLASVARDEMDYHYLWLMLRTPEGSIPVAIRGTGGTLDAIIAMIDAEVSVCGVLQRLVVWTRPFSYFISVNEGLAAITVKTPPPNDPFSAPLLSGSHTLHRQRANGIVLATAATHFYLRTPWRRQLKVTPADGMKLPRAGESITAVGFSEGNQYDLRLVDALIRPERVSDLPMPMPQSLSEKELYEDAADERNLNVQHNGQLITIEGRLPYVPERDKRTLTIECGARRIVLDLSGVDDPIVDRLASGMRLRVTGLCLARFNNNDSSALFPSFSHYVLLPRSAADLEIIGNPPWWTPGRLLGTMGLLLAILIGSMLWNRSLHALSQRRGAQLFAEQIDHARSELKVAERTRLAVELHDNLAQTLTAVNLQIETAKRHGRDSSPELLRNLEIAGKTLNSCRDELRNCLWDLRSEALESSDMATAIRQAIRPNVENRELHIRFAVPRELLSDKTAHSILCIIRELCINAIRHGNATVLKIAGSIENDTLRFSVRDNGSGFDPQHAPGIREGHFGLQGIRERVSQFNGSFTIENQKDCGTRAEVSVRLSPVRLEA